MGHPSPNVRGSERGDAQRRIVVRAIAVDLALGRALERLSHMSLPNPHGQLLARHTADAPWAALEPKVIESFLGHVEATLYGFALDLGRLPLPVVVQLQRVGWCPAVFAALARDRRLGHAVDDARRERIRAVLDDARQCLEAGLRELACVDLEQRRAI